MGQYSIIVFLLAVSIFLSAAAPKIKIPYPIVLLLAGIGVGFIPDFQRITISPDVIFLIFLPPLLYDAAYNIPFRMFKTNIHTISTLSVSLVFITTAGIAVVAYFLIPGMTWPLAFVLGAILSPPDAVAAAGITKGLNLPHRTNTILEGESLINDASALVAYRFAVAAVAGVAFIPWKAGVMFVVALAGGCLVGIGMWFVFAVLLKRIRKNKTAVVSLNLLLPFVTYLLAEELHVSGVIAVVTVGLVVARHRETIFPEQSAEYSRSVWDTIIFLLNGLIFILIGLEFPYVLESTSKESFWILTGCSVVIFLVALAIRMTVVFWHKGRTIRRYEFFQKNSDRLSKRKKELKDYRPLSWKESVIIGWSGMRGIVSLATALALPLTMSDGTFFPYRNVILFITVEVVVMMLVVQGLGLPLLLNLLKVKEDEDESELF